MELWYVAECCLSKVRATPERGFKEKDQEDTLKLSACKGIYIEAMKILFLNKYTISCASWEREVMEHFYLQVRFLFVKNN
jgi:hypothetical protein